jgi:hypothetical protein
LPELVFLRISNIRNVVWTYLWAADSVCWTGKVNIPLASINQRYKPGDADENSSSGLYGERGGVKPTDIYIHNPKM